MTHEQAMYGITVVLNRILDDPSTETRTDEEIMTRMQNGFDEADIPLYGNDPLLDAIQEELIKPNIEYNEEALQKDRDLDPVQILSLELAIRVLQLCSELIEKCRRRLRLVKG